MTADLTKGPWLETTAPGDTERTFIHGVTGERWSTPLPAHAPPDGRRYVDVTLTLALAEGWRRELMVEGSDPALDNPSIVADGVMRRLQGPWSLHAIDVAVRGR